MVWSVMSSEVSLAHFSHSFLRAQELRSVRRFEPLGEKPGGVEHCKDRPHDFREDLDLTMVKSFGAIWTSVRWAPAVMISRPSASLKRCLCVSMTMMPVDEQEECGQQVQADGLVQVVDGAGGDHEAEAGEGRDGYYG